MDLPLEDRKIPIHVNGILRSVSALHTEWLLPREWVSYVTPPEPLEELPIVGAKDTWLQHSQLVIDDLHTLLSTPYHVFWSHVCYDKDLLKHLGRLLKRLPRPHDKIGLANYPDDEIKRQLAAILTLSFHTVLRMSTYKESKEDFMSKSFFAKLVYENFVLDVPKILDICSLYSHGNGKLVKKLVGNLFDCQPKYLNDFRLCSSTMIDAFQQVTVSKNCQF